MSMSHTTRTVLSIGIGILLGSVLGDVVRRGHLSTPGIVLMFLLCWPANVAIQMTIDVVWPPTPPPTDNDDIHDDHDGS